jgi:hypothetical protein
VDLLQQQQGLHRLQTEWLLQLVKTKQGLEKQTGVSAKLEAAACARLLDGARDLPELYDAAVVRLKQPAFTSLPVLKDAMKATGQLSAALTQALMLLQKTPPEAFASERALEPKDAALGLNLLEAADEIGVAINLLDRIEENRDPMPVKSAQQIVRKSKETCQAALKACQKLKEAKQPLVDVEKIVTPLSGLLDDKGPFARSEDALRSLETAYSPKAVDPANPNLARAELRELQTGFKPLRTETARLVVVGGLPELALRQEVLHTRLKKHHDDVVFKLLDGLDK